MIFQNWDSSKFTVENATAGARRILNENLMLSMFVYLDETDVTKNVIYVSRKSCFSIKDSGMYFGGGGKTAFL